MSKTAHRKVKLKSAIPHKQWNMPAGYHPDGRPAAFRHVLNPNVPTVDGDRLTDKQRAELAAVRIGLQKKFRLGTLANGVVGKRRALKEIAVRSPVGNVLIDIEHRAIRLMREYAEQHPEIVPPARRPTTAPRRAAKPKSRASRLTKKGGRSVRGRSSTATKRKARVKRTSKR